DDASGTIECRQSVQIGFGTLRLVVAVDIESADPVVEVDELLGRDLAGQQRVQAVLDTDVVDRPRSLAVRPDAEHRLLIVLDRAAGTLRIGYRIVAPRRIIGGPCT